MVYSFAISTGNLNFILILPVILGIIVIALGLFTKKKNENTKGIKNTFYITVGVGLSLIILGLVLFFILNVPYKVKIGSGYISVSGPSIAGGSLNVTSNEIKSAYVGNIITGNLTISVRTGGTSIGNLNAGNFLLSNNAKAYLASENSTDIIIKLKSGNYLIIGNNDTNALAAIVSRYVYNLS
jgi:hypothetical protein